MSCNLKLAVWRSINAQRPFYIWGALRLFFFKEEIVTENTPSNGTTHKIVSGFTQIFVRLTYWMW